MPIFSYTQLFIEKYLDITWNTVKYAFIVTNYKVDMEGMHVYIDFQKSGFHKVAHKFPIFPCVDIIKCTLPHIDTKIMTLSSVSGQWLSSYMAYDFHLMYHFPFLEAYMDSHFYVVANYLIAKNVIKTWVKEASKLC